MMDEAAKPEFLMGIVCVLMLVGSFATWEIASGQFANTLVYWHGTTAFIGGLLLLFGTLVNYDFLRIKQLDRWKPLTNAGVGVLGSLLGISGAATARFLLKCGAIVVATDQKSASDIPVLAELTELGAEFAAGSDPAFLLDD